MSLACAHDGPLVRLGLAGHVQGIEIDTAWFTGNQTPAARVFAVPVPIAPPASPNERAMPVADFARLLQRAIEARLARLEAIAAKQLSKNAELATQRPPPTNTLGSLS